MIAIINMPLNMTIVAATGGRKKTTIAKIIPL